MTADQTELSKPGVLARVRIAGAALSVALAVSGVLALMAGPMLYRVRLLDADTATRGLEQWAMMSFGAGLVLAIATLLLSFIGRTKRAGIVAIAAMLACGYAFGQLWGRNELRRSLPPVHDVQTDLNDPVELASAPPQTASPEQVTALAAAYDLKPLTVPAPPAQAAKAVAEAARRLGWSVTREDAERIEATRTTAWYGFKSDLAVRIRAEGTGSRIDARAARHEPIPDMGANAQALTALLNEVAFVFRGD